MKYDANPMLDGQILIYSKEHVGSAAELPMDEFMELMELKKLVGKVIAEKYGVVAFYEHGRTGCCKVKGVSPDLADHFHLNIVPFTGDLTLELSKDYFQVMLRDYREVRQYRGNYMYFENSSGQMYFYPVPKGKTVPPSYFRTLIGLKAGVPEKADWHNGEWANRPQPTRERAIADLRARFCERGLAESLSWKK